jgi:hypothetical protein
MMHTIRQRLNIPSLPVIRLLVAGGLIVGLLGIGFVTPHVRPELVLLALAIPAAALLAIGQLELGVLATIATAAFVRFSLGTGTESRVVASLMVVALFIMLWVVEMFVREQRLYLKWSSVNVPLLGFLLTSIVSYVWSNAFRDPLVVVWSSWPFVQLGGLAVMLLLPGAFLLTVNSISEVRWLRFLWWLMILVGILALADYLLPIRLAFLNTGGLFSLWFVSLTYAQALFNRRLPAWLRLVLLGLMLSWMYVYFFTRVTWLSGWLPPLAAIGTISLLRSKRLLLILVLAMAIYVGINWEYYTDTVLNMEIAESGNTRLSAWRHNWRVTGKHLLFGTGPAGYAAYYMSYFPSEAMATHSNYIDILSQTGIVGLVFCVWFFGAVGRTGYRLCKQLRGSGDFREGFAAATLAGWLGCVLAMGLGDWLFPFVYTQTIAGFDYAIYSWVLLGGMVALATMYSNREAVGAADD